jgi:tRNA(Ile)-lysidine synthase
MSIMGCKQLQMNAVKHGQAWCQSLGVEFDCRYVDWQGDISSMGNIEARARAMRYKNLEEMCVAHQITQLLMAHHEDDQAETLLLQLLRGSGVAGLAGMPMQKKTGDDGITFLRPLLQTPTSPIRGVCKSPCIVMD